MKKDIEDQKKKKMLLDTEAERTNVVLKSIKNALVNMLTKLQEMDELTADLQAKRKVAKNLNFPTHEPVNEATSTDQIVKMLHEKVKVGLIASGKIGDGDGIDSGLDDEEDEPPEARKVDGDAAAEGKAIKKTKDYSGEEPTTSQAAETEVADKRLKSSSEASFVIDEKPQPYPQVYSSLIAGRSTGLVSASPGAGGGKQTFYQIFRAFSSNPHQIYFHKTFDFFLYQRRMKTFVRRLSHSPWEIIHYGDSLMIFLLTALGGSLFLSSRFQESVQRMRQMFPVDRS